MFRMLRIVGIIVFALIAGVSANSLYKMYNSGSLFEKYNSDRKSNVTLLAFSLVSLCSLGAVELVRLRQAALPKGYGARHGKDEQSDEIEGRDASSLYSAPKTVDEWNGRRIASARPRGYKPRYFPEMSEIWMGYLSIVSAALPFVYSGVFVVLRARSFALPAWVVPSVFSVLLLVSLSVAIGVFRKKKWGLATGYVLAIVNLVFFPIGSAIGVLLLIGLVGASPRFSMSSSRKSSKVRSLA